MGMAPPLHDRLLARLRAEGPIPFEEFMRAALYDPALGYYCRPEASIGPAGDFRTSPEIHRAFGLLMARQVAEIARRAAPPGAPLRLCEAGPGRGTLARDLLDGLAGEAPDLARRTTLTLVECSPSLREAQRATLVSSMGAVERIEWSGWDDLVAHPPEDGSICVVANEFLDALPVRRLERREGRLLEVFVAEREGRFVEVLDDPSDPAVVDHLARLERDEGIRIEEGQRVECGLQALDWVSSLGRVFGRGARGGAILIDYGFPARTLYHPARRGGMLMCYHRHRAASDPYVRVGEQDMTAHVDFTSVERRARESGFDVAGPISQMRFLIALGLADWFAERAAHTTAAAHADRLALHALMAPEGMGEIFKVMLLGHGCDVADLSGARDPFRERGAGDRVA